MSEPTGIPIPVVSIYVFRAEHGVKIGLSTDVAKRAHGLRTAAGVAVEVVGSFECAPGANPRKLESEIFDELADCRGLGEWFDCSPEKALSAVRKVLGISPRAAAPAAKETVTTPRSNVRRTFKTLRDIRQAKGLSLGEVQEATGINKGTLSFAENGRQHLTRAQIDAIERALGLEPESLQLRIVYVAEQDEA